MKKTGSKDSGDVANEKLDTVKNGIQSIEVGLPLLSELARGTGAVTLTELAKSVNMATSKAHKYLASFIRLGFVEQEPLTGKYDLSTSSLELGLSALRRVEVPETAGRYMSALRDEIGQTVTLTSWIAGHPTIVRIIECVRPIGITIRAGSVLPVLSSSSGPVLAAYLDRSQTQSLIDAELSAGSPVLKRMGVRKKEDVEELLRRVRTDGLARSKDTVLSGISGLSAPVFNHIGIVATLNVLAVDAAVDFSHGSHACESLRKTASQLSHRLGWRP